jgi:hypothetical protein
MRSRVDHEMTHGYNAHSQQIAISRSYHSAMSPLRHR